MLGVVEPGRLTLFRRVQGRLVFWRVVVGDKPTIDAAIGAARELTIAAGEVGGWAKALCLGLNATEPEDPGGLVVPLFPQHGLDGSLGVLELSSGLYRKGPVRVHIDELGLDGVSDELGGGDA